MKLMVFTTATLFGLALLPLAHAQVGTTGLRADIPFQFQAGEAVLPAGKYAVSKNTTSQGVVNLWGLDRKTIFFLTHTAASQPQENAKLIFHCYGNTYFLWQVWQGGQNIGQELRPSKAERVIAQQMAALPTPHNVELASISLHPLVK